MSLVRMVSTKSIGWLQKLSFIGDTDAAALHLSQPTTPFTAAQLGSSEDPASPRKSSHISMSTVVSYAGGTQQHPTIDIDHVNMTGTCTADRTRVNQAKKTTTSIEPQSNFLSPSLWEVPEDGGQEPFVRDHRAVPTIKKLWRVDMAMTIIN